MYKIVYIILLQLVFILEASEPTLVILKSIHSNNSQIFTLSNYSFSCKAYGIENIENIYEKENNNITCKKALVEFYQKHPRLKTYVQEKLYLMNMYHIEFKQSGCLIYVGSQMTLSELLLKEGLAIIKTNFRDDEHKGAFLQAQDSAKYAKKGIWGEDILKKCLFGLKKD
jgi:hypothetical protein